MPRFFSIFSPLFRLFPITLSPPPPFSFFLAPLSSSSSSSPLPFFHPSISAPSSQGSDLSWDGSKVSRDFLIKRKHGWKGLIYIPREQGQRLRRRHGFPWFRQTNTTTRFRDVVDRVELLSPSNTGENCCRDSRLWPRFMKSGEMLTFYRVWVGGAIKTLTILEVLTGFLSVQACNKVNREFNQVSFFDSFIPNYSRFLNSLKRKEVNTNRFVMTRDLNLPRRNLKKNKLRRA